MISHPDQDAPLPPAPEGFASPTGTPYAPLPGLRGGDHMTAVALGAEALFVHWHIEPRSLARLKGAMGGGPLKIALRAYLLEEGGEGARKIVDQPVDRLSGHLHMALDAGHGGRWAVISVGLADDETFGHLVRSAPVYLPHPGRPAAHGGARLDLERLPLTEQP